jgi:hypothetical protein
METAQTVISPYAPAPETFSFPAVYEGMEVFEGRIDEKISRENNHLFYHIQMLERFRRESIAEGEDPFGPKLSYIENLIMKCETAKAELECLDINDELLCFQTCLKSAALMNEVEDLEEKYNFTFEKYFKVPAADLAE